MCLPKGLVVHFMAESAPVEVSTVDVYGTVASFLRGKFSLSVKGLIL